MTIRRRPDGTILEERREAPPEGAPMPEIAGFVRPSSWNEEQRTLDFVLSDSRTNTVLRRDFWGDVHEQQLSLDAAAVDLRRMNGGAPFLRVHRSSDDLAQIGKWVEGSVRIEGLGEGAEPLAEQLVGTVAFSPHLDEESERVVREYAGGYRRNASVGFHPHETVITERDDGPDHHLVVRWEPVEGSGVPIGADAGATTRSGDNRPHSPLITRRDTMAPKTTPVEETAEAERLATERAAEVERLAAERATVLLAQRDVAGARADRVGKLLGLGAEAVEGFRREATTIVGNGLAPFADVQERMYAAAEAATAAPDQRISGSHGGRVTAGAYDEADTRGLAMASYLLCHRGGLAPDTVRAALIANGGHHGRGRILAPGVAPDVLRDFDFLREGGQYMGRRGSLIALAEACLRADGVRVDGFSDEEIARAAFGDQTLLRGATSTSLSLLLGGVVNTSIFAGYTERPFSAPWAQRVTAADFRQQYLLTLGETEDLEELGEKGEFKKSQIREAREGYSVSTYGRDFEFTREFLINDMWGLLTRIPGKFGASVVRNRKSLLVGVLTGNPTMSDGEGLFSAVTGNRTFANIAATAAIPTIASIDVMRVAMNGRPGLGNVDEAAKQLEFPISWFVCSDLWITRFEQELGLTRPTTTNRADSAGLTTQIPRSFGGYDVHPEPLLNTFNPGGGAGNAWFGTTGEAVVYAELEGHAGPKVTTYAPQGTLGQVVRVYDDFGVGPVEARAIQRNNGAAS